MSLLACNGISRRYGAFQALRGVDFALEQGEVRALLGANGAGKSTLIKILSGQIAPTEGILFLDNERTTFHSPAVARQRGIEVVHQELSVISSLTVEENITLGRWPTSKPAGLIDRNSMRRSAYEALRRLAPEVPRLSAPLSGLPPAQRQFVEIAKALASKPRILILDEPTSSLGSKDAASLLEVVRQLANEGVAVVYVSHRMDEIHRIADTITILRSGSVVTSGKAEQMTTSEIVHHMVGDAARRDASQLGRPDSSTCVRDKRAASPIISDYAICVRGLSTANLLKDIDVRVRAGEVVGVAGLLGSGRTELLRAIFGLDRRTGGSVLINGQGMPAKGIAPRIRAGVGFVPEDRRSQGLVQSASVSENLVMASYGSIRSRFLGLSSRRQQSATSKMIDDLGIDCSRASLQVSTLSGGNQQKVVLGKWLNRGSSVLLLDEPTRGVDVPAKAQIYDLIRKLAADGTSILFVSSEEEEMYGLCDRIVVLKAGAVVADARPSDLPLARLLEVEMGGMI